MNRDVINAIERTLRVESLNFGRTPLEPRHCPNVHTRRQMLGVNVYEGGSITCEIEGENPIVVPAGEGVFLPAGVNHRFPAFELGRTVSLWQGVSFSILDAVDPISLLNVPLRINARLAERARTINEELRATRLCRQRDFLRYAAKRKELAMRLFELTLDASTMKPDTDDFIVQARRLQPALRYLKNHLNERVSTAELAATLSISEPRLFDLFKASLGCSPGRYAQRLRLRRAQELLIGADMRIGEVAEAVGYQDPFHFSRLFKKRVGVSPNGFRDQHFSRRDDV